MNDILAIDPSIVSLGWAVLRPRDGVSKLLEFGTVERDSRGLPAAERVNIIIEGLEEKVLTLGAPILTMTVVIEQPQLWGSYKSTASIHSGALLGLHILVGALYWWAHSHFDEAYLIPVTEWKGQLPKRVTQQRMEAKYNVKFETDDESDAVGLADYFIEQRMMSNLKGNLPC